MGFDYKGQVDICVSDDEMTVEIVLAAPTEECEYDVDSLIGYLNENKVLYGIDKDAIEDMVKNKTYNKSVVVAKGKECVASENGYYEYYFDIEPSSKPKLNADGTVDYFNLSILQTVEENQLLAKYFPKKEGIDGYKITGEVIKAATVKDMPPIRGKGIRVSEDEKEYYATCDGKVELKFGCINVLQTHIVMGDVDLSTGHINFRGDVEIMGNITSGMNVKTTGNITINGIVEGAQLTAGKDVLIRGGIIGGNKAIIESGGNIFAKFIENAEIRSKASVNADSIVNCIVSAHTEIRAIGKNSVIVGGRLKAYKRILTGTLGSHVGVRTEVEVGTRPEVLSTKKSYEDNIKLMQDKLDKLEDLVERLSKLQNKNNETMMQAVRSKIEVSADIHKTKALLEELTKKIEIGKNSSIAVEGRVFPGVSIMVEGVAINVNDIFEGIEFLRKGANVLTRQYQKEED